MCVWFKSYRWFQKDEFPKLRVSTSVVSPELDLLLEADVLWPGRLLLRVQGPQRDPARPPRHQRRAQQTKQDERDEQHDVGRNRQGGVKPNVINNTHLFLWYLSRLTFAWPPSSRRSVPSDWQGSWGQGGDPQRGGEDVHLGHRPQRPDPAGRGGVRGTGHRQEVPGTSLKSTILLLKSEKNREEVVANTITVCYI